MFLAAFILLRDEKMHLYNIHMQSNSNVVCDVASIQRSHRKRNRALNSGLIRLFKIMQFSSIDKIMQKMTFPVFNNKLFHQ